MSDLSEELLAIRLELKGVRETVEGYVAVREEQERTVGTTRAIGTESEKTARKTGVLSRAFGALGKAAKYGIGILGVGGIFALKAATENTENLGLATASLSRNFGFSTNVASRWAAVLHSREIDPKALSMAFGTLSSKMVEAGRKGSTALTPFHQLGISQEEVQKGAKNFEWGLLRVARALGEEEGGAKRSTAAKALLGKGFQTLTPLFSEGVKGLKEQLHWADEYGVTLNKTTEEGIYGMVKGQRELKIASLGLQLGMTKALMPAIEGGEDQLKEFIKTLNDPDLTSQQKINRIEKQFEGLEEFLFQELEKMLPHMAEQGGKLGLRLAIAVFHSFQNAGVGGKLVIGLWIFKAFGGEALVMAGARRVGGRIGTEIGLGLGAGVTGAFIAYEVWEHLSQKSKLGVMRWVDNASEWFVNGLIHRVNEGIHLINEVFAKSNVFAFLGMSAPEIGEVGSVEFGGELTRKEAKLHREEGLIEGPGGKLIPGPSKAEAEQRRHHPNRRRSVPNNRPRPNSSGLSRTFSAGARRPIVIESVVNLDGKEIARNTTQHAEDEAAFR